VVTDRIKALYSRVRLVQNFRTTFETPSGKEVLKQIMREGFVTRSTFVAGDPHQTSLNEGSRRLALSICKFATKDESEFLRLIQEEEMKARLT
jgi:hypothetical protein